LASCCVAGSAPQEASITIIDVALIPPFFLDTVVAVGITHTDSTRWVGTGFLYLHVESRTGNTATGKSYLVTNKHVVEGFAAAKIRANPQADEPAREFELALVGPNSTSLWFGHPDPAVDVAVVPINYQILLDNEMQVNLFHSDAHASSRKQLVEQGAAEGDGCFILGFPMGMVGERRASVIIRSGTIARLRDTLAGAQDFLVDAQVFPGNSGGPVVSRPEVVSIQGTSAMQKVSLIGIVRSYVPYQDIAISNQTSRPRVIFEENTGLASVHPVDCIEEAIAVHLSAVGSPVTGVAPSETIDTSHVPI
jgi:S1-C subfamily serine protease